VSCRDQQPDGDSQARDGRGGETLARTTAAAEGLTLLTVLTCGAFTDAEKTGRNRCNTISLVLLRTADAMSARKIHQSEKQAPAQHVTVQALE
jgi:hypothetical protein